MLESDYFKELRRLKSAVTRAKNKCKNSNLTLAEKLEFLKAYNELTDRLREHQSPKIFNAFLARSISA